MWVHIILAILLLFWWYQKKDKIRTPDHRLPGPKGLPLIGNCLCLATPTPHVAVTELGDRYGPIYKLEVLNEHWVVINNFDLIYEVLVSKGHFYSGRPGGFRLEYLGKHTGVPLLRDLNPTLSKMRQMSIKGLKNTEMRQKDEVMTHIRTNLLDMFSHHNGCAYDPMNDLYIFACSLMAHGLLGEELLTETNLTQTVVNFTRSFVEALQPCAEGYILDKCPWTRVFNGKIWQKCGETRKLADEMYLVNKEKIVARIGKSGDSDQSMMHWVMDQLQQQEGGLDDDAAKGILSGLISGGAESTAVTLYTIIGLLAHYPHIQKRLYDEVDNVIGQRSVALADRSKCHYVEATILEVLRNTEIAPLLFLHKAMQDTTLDVYHIPKGTMILTNVWKMHHDSAFWEEPFDYRPERFLNEEGHLVSPEHVRRRHVLAFGAGTRVCPGKAFANNRLFLTVVAICQRFSISPIDKPDPASMDPRKFQCRGFTINPYEFKVRMIERSFE